MTAAGWRRGLALALALALAMARAATLTIDAGDDPDARLELRRTLLPSGVEVELVVLTGRSITLTVDDVVVVGQRIELDVDGRTVRVIGPGSFASGDERLEGVDLELRLDEERLRAIDAVVFTSAIDVTGELAERLPGQLTFAGGLASPCTRCGQEVLDYAFRAERMVLYPGDRLVGYDVTVLIRGVAVLRLPLLVIPLAQGDRQPQFAIGTGTAAQRAEVRLRWPYVAGPDALGTFTVRYLADVNPSVDAGLVGRLLGGAVEASYVGFELDHRVYDEVGSGVVLVAYEPRRLARAAGPGVPAHAGSDDRWTVRLAYTTAEDEPRTTVGAELTRDDARTPGRWLYGLGLTATDRLLGEIGVRMRVDSQGFVDTDPAIDARTPPTYANRATPIRTPLRLRLEPVDLAPAQLGRLRVTAAALDLGLFQDAANPVNRRAAAAGLVDEGRALLQHQLVLDPWTPWTGARIEGDNRFEGRYYAQGERAVAWRSRFSVTQAFGRVATVSATLTRDVAEGETPFRFDAAAVRTRTDVQFRASLRPAAWVGLETTGGYVLVENRRPETVGWAPLSNRLTLFEDRPWIDASLEHVWPIRDDDPGTLRAALSLQARENPVELRFTVEHLQDLRLPPDEPRVAETVTRATWRAAYDRVASLDVSAAYRPDPAPDGTGRVRRLEPSDVRLTLGDLRSGEERPGLGLQAVFDPELSRFDRLTVEGRARWGAAEFEARQRIELPAGSVSDASLAVTWDDVARLEARGLVWLPPAWLGHPEEEPRLRQLSVQLREVRAQGTPRWEATWRSSVDPALEGSRRRDTRFEVRTALFQEVIGPWLVSAEAQVEWALADELQPDAFLRRATLVIGADAWERVGLQGRLGYEATYDGLTGTLARRELTIDDLTLAVRPTDALTLGARLRDVWELTGTDAARSPWNFRPEVFFVWDRCCWALSGAWNAATGTVRIVLTGPGASTGLEQVLETGWSLPRTALREPTP